MKLPIADIGMDLDFKAGVAPGIFLAFNIDLADVLHGPNSHHAIS